MARPVQPRNSGLRSRTALSRVSRTTLGPALPKRVTHRPPDPSDTLCHMTYGNEPRRRGRSSDSSRRGDHDDEAEDWLAGYRPAPDEHTGGFGRRHGDTTGESTGRHGATDLSPPTPRSPRSSGSSWEEPGRHDEPARSHPQPRRASGADPVPRPATGRGGTAGPGGTARDWYAPPDDTTGVFPSGPTSGPPVGTTGGLPAAGSTGGLPAVDRRWTRLPDPGDGPTYPPRPVSAPHAPAPVAPPYPAGPVSPPYPPPLKPPVQPPLQPQRGAPPAPDHIYGYRSPEGYGDPPPSYAEPMPRVDPTSPWTDLDAAGAAAG